MRRFWQTLGLLPALLTVALALGALVAFARMAMAYRGLARALTLRPGRVVCDV